MFVLLGLCSHAATEPKFARSSNDGDKVDYPSFAGSASAPNERRSIVALAIALTLAAVIARTVSLHTVAVNGVLPLLMGSIIVTELLSAALFSALLLETGTIAFAYAAAGYLLSGFLAIPYLLTFPNVFVFGILLGGGRQSALELWILWHAAYPVLIACSALSQRGRVRRAEHPRKLLTITVVACALVTIGCFAAVLRWGEAVPSLIDGSAFTPLMTLGALPVLCALDLLAIAAIGYCTGFRTRTYAWLAVAVYASLLDAILGVTAARYTSGWYAGKILAFISSATIIGVFLYAVIRLYHDLARAYFELERVREREAAELAHEPRRAIDETTGLPNRREFRARLAQAIAAPEARSGVSAVIVADVDRFKVINDAIGHEGGDRFLQAVASRLTAAATGAFIARSTGDEFSILLTGVRDRDDVATYARRLLKAASAPVIIYGREFALSVSIGVALFPDDAQTADELIRSADIAMYEAKAAGRAAVTFFSSAMRDVQIERGLLETEIRAALRSDAFQLEYQPIVHIETGRVNGAEALLRWAHPTRGQVSPALFVDVAENAGLMGKLGSWVLREGIRQRARWNSFDRDFRLALNVSAGQLADRDFALLLGRTLAGEHVAPSAIELEITESIAMEGSTVAEQMRRCLALGVRFSLDDFGTHYSSLSYLQRLSVERIKIDRSFITELPGNGKDGAIAKAVIQLAHSLGRTVVAEGVEDNRQLAWLREAGCDFAQGYFIAKPMTAVQFERWMVVRAQGKAARHNRAG